MADKKSPVHLIFTIMYVVLAVLTVIPKEAASKDVCWDTKPYARFPQSARLFYSLWEVFISCCIRKPPPKKSSPKNHQHSTHEQEVNDG